MYIRDVVEPGGCFVKGLDRRSSARHLVVWFGHWQRKISSVKRRGVEPRPRPGGVETLASDSLVTFTSTNEPVFVFCFSISSFITVLYDTVRQ